MALLNKTIGEYKVMSPQHSECSLIKNNNQSIAFR
jgi:hypothetical protein